MVSMKIIRYNESHFRIKEIFFLNDGLKAFIKFILIKKQKCYKNVI